MHPDHRHPNRAHRHRHRHAAQLRLNWTAIPNNTGYTIDENTVNNEAGATTVGNPATNSFVDTAAHATLFYFVYATQFGSSKLVGTDSGFAKCSR